MPGTPGTPGENGQTGPPGPGAKLLVTEPVASATNEFTELGKAGPFTLHTRCRISGGTVDAHLIATGPSLTSDSTYVRSGATTATVSATESDIKVANPTIAAPKLLANSSANAGGDKQTTWVSGLLQAQSSVSVQAWVRAETASGALTDSCRFSVIVTPLE